MPTSERKPYIPYRHLSLAVVLATLAIAHWFYTPNAASMAQEPKATLELALPSALIAPAIKSASVTPITPSTAEATQEEQSPPTLAIEEPEQKNLLKVVIHKGDTLSTLFDQYKLGQTTLRHILSADESLLALETVRPGQTLYFRYQDNTQVLEEMELYKHPGHRVLYQRIADDAFNAESIIKEGQWHPETINGTIEGSFYLSAQKAGLTESETASVTRIFQDQLDFARTMRKGDQFQVVRSVQYVDEQATGQSRIESARIQQRKREHTAFLFADGRYYDKKGNSLARAFTRTPLAKNYRISSPFNPKRVHPVTGRVGPHNGTDFATPQGTKVLSTGDGVVTRVGNHPFAGRYIEIKHGGQYKTRYLHLHRVLVHKGESVHRGQAIALSGNTGRSTGPHLHFELHIHGRPVNPMTAKIPTTQSIDKDDQAIFAQKVSEQIRRLDGLPLSEPTTVAAKQTEPLPVVEPSTLNEGSTTKE